MLYKYLIKFGFTDYDDCDYQEAAIQISFPASIDLSSVCTFLPVCREIVRLSYYNPSSVKFHSILRIVERDEASEDSEGGE